MLWMTQESECEQVTGYRRYTKRRQPGSSRSGHDFLDVEEAPTERNLMYISLTAVVVILLLFLLFRTVSGRRA